MPSLLDEVTLRHTNQKFLNDSGQKRALSSNYNELHSRKTDAADHVFQSLVHTSRGGSRLPLCKVGYAPMLSYVLIRVVLRIKGLFLSPRRHA